MSKGILTGCDENQEWMLKWWWGNYSKHCPYPVTFCDFGMSKSAKEWCGKRGNVVTITPPPLTPKEEIPEKTQEIWEELYGPTLWEARSGWSLKPFAFLKSPYKKTVWLDLDCQILQPLTPLFEIPEQGIAMAYEVERALKKCREKKLLLPGEKQYNTGVVAFEDSCPLLPMWAERTLSENHLFLGDQTILSRIIHEQKYPLTLLPDIYNRHPQDGCTPDTCILHFVGSGGKHYLLKHLNI